jgi:hypothetical protein
MVINSYLFIMADVSATAFKKCFPRTTSCTKFSLDFTKLYNSLLDGRGKVVCATYNARAVKGMNCLRSLKHWNRGFESHSRHTCLCAFILFVFFCV